MSKNLLLIEDESGIADNIVYAFKAEGFAVSWETLGSKGLERIRSESFELAILDVGLPDMSGFDVCKEIRKISDLPIVFLTARGDEIDRVVGFEIGADDYVVKPFSPRELVVRVKAILRRTRNQQSEQNSADELFQIDKEKRRILYAGNPLELTAYEYGILELLVKQPGRVYTREQLLNAVWASPEESVDRAVDTHVKTIRAKLKAVNENDNSLITHRGVGYSIRES